MPVVLVVEDKVLIRLNAVAIVTDAGFEALEAANADEAIRVLESRDDIRVIFTDIQMPGSMDGLNLSHAVRAKWPPIKIIVTSGLARVTELDLPEGARFIAKPYLPSEIALALGSFDL
jgi:two-component system, response regulator PdtaR